MTYVKQNFSIKDLENLSGIRAHTIRIWEKRYGLLKPQRTDSNVRFYDLSQLQKLLNITMLYQNGMKISKIASISDKEIAKTVDAIVSKPKTPNNAISCLKLAMLNYDFPLFQTTYDDLLKSFSFREIFLEVFMPLLAELGLLWQTNTINEAQEHFITHLIRQKIIVNTDKLQVFNAESRGPVFVLFLPENEIHDIGLLYLNYEMIWHSCHTIYLGASVPLDCMVQLQKQYESIYFISYFTVEPHVEALEPYIAKFQQTLNAKETNHLWILGSKTNHIKQDTLPSRVKTFEGVVPFLKAIKGIVQ